VLLPVLSKKFHKAPHLRASYFTCIAYLLLTFKQNSWVILNNGNMHHTPVYRSKWIIPCFVEVTCNFWGRTKEKELLIHNDILSNFIWWPFLMRLLWCAEKFYWPLKKSDCIVAQAVSTLLHYYHGVLRVLNTKLHTALYGPYTRSSGSVQHSLYPDRTWHVFKCRDLWSRSVYRM